MFLWNPWNSLGFSMIQLAIWFMGLPFLNPVCISGSSQFTYCWSLAWRILSITLLACEMSAQIRQINCWLYKALHTWVIGVIFVFSAFSKFSWYIWKFSVHILLKPSFKDSEHYLATLAWKIPWTEEPGRLWSMGSRRVKHDWATSFSLFTFMHWRGKWQLTPVFLPGESLGWGSLVGCRLWGHTKSDMTEVT